MSELELKFNSLNFNEQRIILDMVNLLILRKNPSKLSEYKKKILTISTWSEDDLKVFEENKIVNWNVPSW
ncbi:MAG: hypothetical protein KBA66_12405 [Leptospiraceae bacterium]|nr:hypothetical protein [Leptospiraceae bacterium]